LSVPVGATLISLVIYGPQALATPSGGWPRVLAEVAAVFVLLLVLFQLAQEIGFTGFLQHHWQDRYHPLKLTFYVALLWAVWHIPDHFAVEGWVVSLFFARALFVWFYNRTGSSVLLVCDLPRQLRCSNQPALLRCGTGAEHYKILDLQRRNHSFRSNGDHRHQRPAGAAPRRTICGRRHSSRAPAR